MRGWADMNEYADAKGSLIETILAGPERRRVRNGRLGSR